MGRWRVIFILANGEGKVEVESSENPYDCGLSSLLENLAETEPVIGDAHLRVVGIRIDNIDAERTA